MNKERTKIVNSEASCEEMCAEVRRLFETHRHVEFSWREGRQRTSQQNKALHKFCSMLAETLNDSGLDMRRVIREDVDIPWSGSAVKEYLWRPIQKAVIEKESTADADRNEYTEVYDVLARHMASRLGVRVPDWPNADREKG